MNEDWTQMHRGVARKLSSYLNPLGIDVVVSSMSGDGENLDTSPESICYRFVGGQKLSSLCFYDDGTIEYRFPIENGIEMKLHLGSSTNGRTHGVSITIKKDTEYSDNLLEEIEKLDEPATGVVLFSEDDTLDDAVRYVMESIKLQHSLSRNKTAKKYGSLDISLN